MIKRQQQDGRGWTTAVLLSAPTPRRSRLQEEACLEVYIPARKTYNGESRCLQGIAAFGKHSM